MSTTVKVSADQVWVIQSSSGRRTLNHHTNRFQSSVSAECEFKTAEEAYDKLKTMDNGFKVRQKRQHVEIRRNYIW